MQLFAMSPSLEKNDDLLTPFLNCDTEDEDDATLSLLIDAARPTIYNSLRRKGLLLNSQEELGKDLEALAIMRIIEQLRRCKRSWQQGDGRVTIRHFPALCQIITSNVVNEHIRLKYPRRTSLQNQLMYLIREVKDENARPRFGLWYEQGERVCGLRVWEREGRAFLFTKRQRLLVEDVQAAKREVLRGEDASQVSLQKMLDLLLRWMEIPIIFDAVVSTMVQWRSLEEYHEQSLSSSTEEGAIPEPIATGLSPEERTIFRESMKHLWANIIELPLKQRAALLLNLCDAQGRGVLGFLPSLGIVSLHEMAKALDFDMQEFAALWPRLPLEDREIAKLYGCTPAIVAVWRSRARAHLKKRVDREKL